MTARDRDRDAHAVVSALAPHREPALEPGGQRAARGGTLVGADRARARRGARGGSREPDRLARDDGLPQQRREHGHERQQRDELDGRLAVLAAERVGGAAWAMPARSRKACDGTTRVRYKSRAKCNKSAAFGGLCRGSARHASARQSPPDSPQPQVYERYRCQITYSVYEHAPMIAIHTIAPGARLPHPARDRDRDDREPDRGIQREAPLVAEAEDLAAVLAVEHPDDQHRHDDEDRVEGLADEIGALAAARRERHDERDERR